MGHLAQSINLPLTERREIVNTGGLVVSPFTGAVNDAVLLFSAAGVVTGPAADMVETNNANDGTSVLVRKAGIYEIKLYVEQTAGTTVTFGVSDDVAAAGLNSDPSFAIAGFLDVQNSVTVAGHTAALSVTTYAFIRPEDQSSIIRFHATNGANGAPAAALTAKAVYYRIRRINQLHS